MVKIKIGCSGLGGKGEAISNLEIYAKSGIGACELAFTYGVYLDKDSATEIGLKAKELGIYLSIHAPYYINLNSLDKTKIESSKKRILDCCEIGHYLSAGSKHKTSIVFHAGFYSKMSPEETFENIKVAIIELVEEVKKRKLNVELCPEVMGKINVFGSIEEISRLVKETSCACCIDFAHILARYDMNKFDLVKKELGRLDHWHCHFSGIIYGDKGEKSHKQTEKKEWSDLLKFLKIFDKDIVVISEAPSPVEDAIAANKML